MSDTPRQPAKDPTVIVVHEPTDCPFPVERLTMRFGFGGIPLNDVETARCVNARRNHGGGMLTRMVVECSAASVILPEGMRPAYPVRARHHIELLIAGCCVHIEAIAQELGGPGGTNSEVRVYVDGVLEGRSILLGRLGATVNTFPVIAMLGPDAVMTVRPVRWASLKDLVVELMHRRNG